MDTDVRRGLGLALVGVLAWSLVALAVLLFGNPPLIIETGLALVAVAGIVTIFVGLGRVAWVLLRR